MGLVLLAVAVIGTAAGWTLRAVTAGRRDTTQVLRQHGLTRHTARLHRRAIRILADLTVATDVDRVNVLDPVDRRRIERLLAEHDKETTP